jgi:tetratricopeptide (TPR) repeat protein
MAKRAPSASAKHSQGKSSQDERWWKTPTIVAAIIAAVAAIGVALINQRATPKSKPPDPTHIEQQTHGPDSPAIAKVEGGVSITNDVGVTASGSGTALMQTGPGSVHITNIHGISEEQHQRLAKELGVTQSALESFFKILEQTHVAPGDLDSTLRDIAKKYKSLQEQLQAFTSEDPVVMTLKRDASKALEAGDFTRVETLLNAASQKDLEGAQQFQEMATKRWLSAAASKAENGRLKDTQLRYAEAVTYYRQAAELVERAPRGAEELLATYLNSWGLAAQKAGDYRSADPPLQRALAIREQALDPEHPHVATALNNLALLYKAQGQYPQAEPLYQRALAIWEQALGPEHPHVATILNNLAVLYDTQGRYPQAEPLYQRALTMREKALGPEHPDVARGLENYAALLRMTNRAAEADKLETRARAILTKHTQANRVQ